MATIVTRQTGTTAVNRPLTNTELDNNFISLNADVEALKASQVSNAQQVAVETAIVMAIALG
jgi:hypothetical protein